MLDLNAMASADDEGNGVCLGLPDSLTARCGDTRLSGGRVVQENVAELVGQRPDGLAAGQARQDADAAGGPQRGAVVWAAGLALDREAFPSGQPAQAVP